MLLRTKYAIIASCALISFTACNQPGKQAEGGPIVLGDPATIVTETDSQYLQDMVMDYQPATQPVTAAADTATTAPVKTDTVTAAEPVQETPAEKGLTIDLGGVKVLIPNITAKGSGTAYQLRSGTLQGNKLKFTEGSVEKVSQRYQSVIVAQSNLGKLVLDNLNALTSWQTINGNGNTYTISGLEENRLYAPKFTAATLRSAITRTARKMRVSRSTEQKWLSSVRNVRTANQKPLDVKLRSVMWKIDGKTAQGKPFNKQLRIDLPI